MVERIALAVHAYGIAARSLDADGGVLPRARDLRQAAGRQPGGAAPARRDAPAGRGGPHLHASRRRARTRPVSDVDRRGVPGQADRGRGVRRTSSTRPCSCTAAPATCTGPRWSGTTATPGSSASAEERPRCSPTCPHDCWDTRHEPPEPTTGRRGLRCTSPRRPQEVWALVSDVTRIGEFSPETFEARWTRGSTGPEVGASFKGHVKRNGVGPTYWSPCQVTACVPDEVFEFSVGTDDVTLNNWGYRLEPDGAGTKVTEYFRLEPTLPMRALLAAARAPARTDQQARHAHDPGADEGGAGDMSNREAMLEKLADLDAEHAKAVAGGGEKYVDAAPRPRQADAARADRAARRPRVGLPRAHRRWPGGAPTSPSAPAWSPASAWSRASSA